MVLLFKVFEWYMIHFFNNVIPDWYFVICCLTPGLLFLLFCYLVSLKIQFLFILLRHQLLSLSYYLFPFTILYQFHIKLYFVHVLRQGNILAILFLQKYNNMNEWLLYWSLTILLIVFNGIKFGFFFWGGKKFPLFSFLTGF